MRPLRLEIEGFTAFRDRQAIDFNDLGLFAITGPTGAGKTSILDAIALALYGEVPRAARGSGELQDLVTHGKRRANVQFEFLAGSIEYRVQRKLPRSGAQQVALERRDGKEWKSDGGTRVAETNARIEEILGLDFDAFTRAVVLPQGAFSEFLTGKAEERRKILVRLLDLKRYERAGDLARRRAAEQDTVSDSLQTVIDKQYQDATPERLSELQARQANCQQRAEQLSALQTTTADLASECTDLDREAAAVTQLVQQIEGGRTQLLAVAQEWLILGPQVERANEAVQTATEALAEATALRTSAQSLLEETVRRTGDQGEIQRLADAAAAVEQEQREVDRLAGDIASGEDRLAMLKVRLTQAETTALAADEAERIARATLETVRAAVEEAKQAFEAAERRSKAEAAVEDAQAKLCDAEAELAGAVEAEERARTEADVLRRKALEVRHQSYAVALRTHLESGQPCPVCEQQVEDVPHGGEAAGEAIAAAETEAENAEQAQRGKEAIANRARQAAAECQARLQVNLQALDNCGHSLNLEQAQAQLDEAQLQQGDAQQAVSTAEEARRSANSACEQAKVAFSGAEAELRGQHDQLVSAAERRERAAGVLRLAFPAGVPMNIVDLLAESRQDLDAATQRLKEREATLETTRRNKEAADEELRRHAAAQSALDHRMAGIVTALGVRSEDLRGLLDGYAFAALPECAGGIEERLAVWGDWSAELIASIKQIDEQFREAAARKRQEIWQALAGLAIEMTTPALVSAEVQRLAEEARAEAIRAETAVTTIDERIASRGNFEEQVRAAQALARQYRALATELRADRFINFVLRESLEQLALQASEELRTISGDRYSLKAADGSFRVVDHANADEVRSVATLSGGETFLASLSLALALSSGITALAGHTAGARLDAIFIDEGFGSLDPETLEVVVEALERLHGGERTVGVITHVPALAERIQAGLAVQRESGASRVVARS